MELHICHLYPDLLNSYGDLGNIQILKYRASKRGITVVVHNVSLGESFNPSEYDIVLFGGGQDFEQSIVAKNLKESSKATAIKEYIENNKVFIAICGGYQLLGKYYVTSDNQKLDGLGILDIYTEKGDSRFIGDVIIESNGNKLVGFENHSGNTYINDLQPLGTVIKGFGNNGKDKTEGCRYRNTYGTYLHGSLLSKNPELADEIILNAIGNKYNLTNLETLDDSFELAAKEVIIKRYKK